MAHNRKEFVQSMDSGLKGQKCSAWTCSSYLDLADFRQGPRQQSDGQLLDLAVQQQVVSGQTFLLQGRLHGHLLPLELGQFSDGRVAVGGGHGGTGGTQTRFRPD